jgi:hypothetical protein
MNSPRGGREKGSTTIPASKYPTSGGNRSRTAMKPLTNANAKSTAIVEIGAMS